MRFAAAMAALTMGPGLGDGIQVGPLVNEPGRDKVEELIADAVQRGAELVTGGARGREDGWYYQPTVLANVPAGSSILREEIFGPVAPIVTFDTEDEGVRLANDTEYGLVAYIYTADLARGLRVSEALESGMIGLNRALVSDPAAPFGGVKQSGLGREGGHDGLLEFMESKYIAVQW